MIFAQMSRFIIHWNGYNERIIVMTMTTMLTLNCIFSGCEFGRRWHSGRLIRRKVSVAPKPTERRLQNLKVKCLEKKKKETTTKTSTCLKEVKWWLIVFYRNSHSSRETQGKAESSTEMWILINLSLLLVHSLIEYEWSINVSRGWILYITRHYKQSNGDDSRFWEKEWNRATFSWPLFYELVWEKKKLK